MVLLNRFVIMGCLLSTGIFVADILAPPNVAFTVMPHFISVVVAIPGRTKSGPWIVGTCAALLTSIAYFIKTPVVGADLFMLNRASIVVLLFATAWLVMKLVTYREVWLAKQTDDLTQDIAIASNARFRDFTEVSSDWFWETDAQLRFTFFSNRFEDVTGVPSDRYLGKTRVEIGAPGADPDAYQALLENLKDRRPFKDFEHRRIKPNGDMVYLTISGKPAYDDAGNFLGFRGIGRDITEQKLNQDTLREALANAERANQAKSEFLATMSHEFRTPLNAILGFSEVLQMQTFGPLGSDNYVEYATDIHDSGKHMLSLINDILDIAAIEAKKRRMVMEPLNVANVLMDCIRTFDYQLDESDVTLSLQCAEDLPALLADERSLFQIVLNLISNAIKHTKPVGEIVVSAAIDADMMVIAVSDTGIGIPADKLPTIFEPFSQVGDNSHVTEQGTGLGLSIVRSLADAHGGSAKIESEEGKGTTVTVSIPLTQPDEEEPADRP